MAETTRYIEAVGRRKTATARVRLAESAKASYVINGDKDIATYFKTPAQAKAAMEAFTAANLPIKFKVSVKVSGGGLQAQSEAIRHGISRALLIIDESLRKNLKAEGFLKRDPRAVERKKFGLKKARKAPRWSKR